MLWDTPHYFVWQGHYHGRKRDQSKLPFLTLEKAMKKITDYMRKQVVQLNKDGARQLEIAKILGISRTSIAKILKQNCFPERYPVKKKTKDERLNFPKILVKPEYHRCPFCGGLVKMPCFACQLRKES